MKRLFGKDGDDKKIKKMEAEIFPRQSKRPKPRPNIPGPTAGRWFDPDKQRNRKINELIKTERDYIRDLKLAVDYYYIPLKYLTRRKGRLRTAMSPELVEKTFGTFPALVRKHESFCQDLRRRWSVSDNDRVISDLLKSFLLDGELLDLYIRYTKDAAEALKEVETAYKVNHALIKYDSKVKKKMTNHGVNYDPRLVNINQFAMKPMQRVTKYGMLLRDLVNMTDSSHPDHAGLQEAHIVAEVFPECVNKERRNIASRVAAKMKSEYGRTFSSTVASTTSSGSQSSWVTVQDEDAVSVPGTSTDSSSFLGARTAGKSGKSTGKSPKSNSRFFARLPSSKVPGTSTDSSLFLGPTTAAKDFRKSKGKSPKSKSRFFARLPSSKVTKKSSCEVCDACNANRCDCV